MELQGSKAIVTGGSEGIGKAIAAALRHAGADVLVTGRRKDVLAQAAEVIGCEHAAGDVGSAEDCARVVGDFVDRHGRLDLLVNNAGFGIFRPLVEMEPEELELVYRTNVFGAFLMAREAARRFVEQESGCLVNVGSTAGLKGGRGGTAYASSKFALRGMTDAWRAELRPSNVRVVLCNPSEVLTSFAKTAGYEQQASPKKLIPEDVADALVGLLRTDDRGFVPEFSVWATNPF